MPSFLLKGLFAVILGVALGITGPYGTYGQVDLGSRLMFWVLMLVAPWLAWELVYAQAKKLLPSDLDPRLLMAFLMPFFAIAGAFFATGMGVLFFGLDAQTFWQAWSQSVLSWLFFSTLIVLPLILIADELSRRQRQTGGADMLGFLTLKLPEKLRGADLIALNSEGHYLRVHTSAGNDLILMSLEDAMSALSGYPGVRTHRSWWVAMDQVSPLANDAPLANELATRSGLKVPVSRRRRTHVRNALQQI